METIVNIYLGIAATIALGLSVRNFYELRDYQEYANRKLDVCIKHDPIHRISIR